MQHLSKSASGIEPMSPLAGTLPPQCQADLDIMRRFVRDCIERRRLAAPVSPSGFGEVLLTGATGLIGRYLLRELLRQNAALRVHCLVRADDAEAGRQRVRAAMQEAEIWDEAFDARIVAVVGDIEQVQLGLTSGQFDELCRHIDAVYHLAADINVQSSYRDIRRLNTYGVRNVLDLCLRRRFKHLFYASTMGVFPQYFCCFANEYRDARIDDGMQPDLAAMKEVFPVGLLGYPWSKLVSEQALQFAQQAGMPLAIFRLPQTNLSSTGYSPADDLAVRLFAAVADTKTLPEGFTFRSSNESVDMVGRVCAAISLNPERCSTIYHCCNPQLDQYDLEPTDFGFYWPVVPYGAFKNACLARGEASPLHGRWAVFDYFQRYWFSRDKPQGRLPVSDQAIRRDCLLPISWDGTFVKLKRTRDWVLRHRQSWPHPIPQSQLDFGKLIARAGSYAGEFGVDVEATYPGWMQQSLQRLVSALRRPEARLVAEDLGNTVFELSRFLRQNAEIAEERSRHPEIARQRIPRPVFIVGINRSGTTMLHRLLARDRRFRTLRLFELIRPILKGGGYDRVVGPQGNPRRAQAVEAQRALDIVRAMEGVHPFDIDEPEEDFPIFKMCFKSWSYVSQFHVPDYAGWLAGSEFGDAYDFHRRMIQHYTWQRRQADPNPDGRWLFKMPFHLLELETLVETYSDALFIQTHRAPSQAQASWNSLVERARSVTMRPVPGAQTGAEQLAFMSDMLNGAAGYRHAHPEQEHRWLDIAYGDLVSDPMATVRTIQDWLGMPPNKASTKEMEAWLAAQAERRQQETRHSYSLEEYSLTPQAVNEAFAPYLDFAATQITWPGKAPALT